MKKLLFLVFFLGCFSFLTAQELKQHDCATDQLHLKLLKESSDYKKKFDSNSILWKKYATEKRTKLSNKNAVTAPIHLTVAFHNMVSSNSTGIVDYDGVVNNLNGFFSTQIGIEFCRALTDAKGNTYDGTLINHSSTETTNIDRTNIEQIMNLVQESGSQGSSTSPKKFPSNKYINIYIVDNIDGNTAGFAFLPPAHGEQFDGIYVERSFLLNDDPNDIKVLVHEMGHYLGLFHVFGICDPDVIASVQGCSCDDTNPYFNGDMVADTPASMLNLGVCGTMDSCPNAFGSDDKENYMDYSLESCKNHFTIGQKERMLFMLDPVWGARSSLINTRACVHCEGLNLCEFSILPPSEIIDSKVQIGTTLTFNQAVQNCETPSNFNYQWTLLNLDTGVVETTVSGNNFSYTPTIIGNYSLTLIASLDGLSDCSEVIAYNFQVLPIPEIISPYDCTTDWTDWENVSYTGGWALTPGGNTTDYVYTSTIRQSPGNPNNFDVIPSYNFADINFPNAVTPSSIANVYRVGKVINSSNILQDGSASFTKVKFRPTPGNCKYRIYYLGMFNGDVSVSTDPKFGFTCQMKYNSPVYSPIVEQHVGKSEWDNRFEPNGITPNYNLNDFALDYSVSELHPQSYNGINYSAMNDWKYKDIDFSEFAKLNENGAANFEVTLTFYSRSNDQAVAKKHCYAYFAVECLGGGVPQNMVWEPKNVDNPCEFPVNSSCYLLELPRPNYTLPTLSWYGDIRYGFANVSSVRTSTDDITYTSAPVTVIQDPEDFKYRLKLCLTQSGSQMYKYFEITYKTINQTFVKKIRVSNQFYHNDPPCANPPIVDGLPVYGGVIAATAPKYYIVCEEKEAPYNYPILTYEDPCFTPTGYKWFCNGIEIDGATSASLDLNLFPDQISGNSTIESKCKIIFERKALYKDPYCGNIVRYVSQPYVVYNKVGNQIQMKRRVDDFCALGDFNMAIDDLYVFRCQEEADYNNSGISSVGNFVKLELFKDQNSTILLQSLPNISFEDMSDVHNNIVFNFHNYNASNPFVPIFMPGNHTVYLSVTYNFYGCTKTFQMPITFSVSPTAVRGSLLVKNDCALDDVIPDPDYPGYTNSTYLWLISVDGGTTYTIIPGQMSANLPNYHHFVSYPRPIGSPTVWVKRMSRGFPTCPGNLITEPVQLPQELFKYIPTFNIPETYCFQDNASTFLPTTSSNNISGTWIPAFNPNNINPSGYTFIPNPNQCAIDITKTVKIITMNSISNVQVCKALAPNTSQTISAIPFSEPGNQGNVQYTWAFYGNNNLGVTVTNSGFTNSFPSITVPNTNSSTIQSTTIMVTPEVNGCKGKPVYFSINRIPNSTITASNPIACNNSRVNINYTSTTIANAFKWELENSSINGIVNPSVNSGSITPINGSTLFSFDAVIPVSAPQNVPFTFNIIVTPVLNTCQGTPKIITVTIKPLPIMLGFKNSTTTIIEPTLNITVCSGGIVPKVIPVNNFQINTTSVGVYSWSVLGNNNINMTTTSGQINNGSTLYGIPTFTAFTNDTDYSQTNTIRVTSTVNGCGSNYVDYTITVLPRAKMVRPDNYTLCVGQIVSIPFSSIIQNETLSYNVTSTGDFNGIPNSILGVSSLNFTTFNNTTAPAVRTVTVTPVRNGCNGKPETFTVIVMPKVDFNISSSSSPLNNMCSETQMTITTSSTLISPLYPSNVLTYTYNYTTSQNVSITGINFNSNGVLQFTGNNNSGSIGTVDFTFAATYSNSNYPNFNCAGPTKTIKISIYPKINLTFPPQNATVIGDIANVTVCKTNVPSLFPSYNFKPSPALTAAGVVYSWTCTSNFAATNLAMSNSGLPSNAAASYTIPAFTITNNTSSPLTVTFVITANFTGSWLPCVVTKTINYTVIPPPTLIANPEVANVVNPNGSVISLVNGSNTIFANDTYNGISLNASQVNLTQISPAITGITLNATTGQITVDSSVPNGTYTLTYMICDKICNTTCSQPATVTINVTRTAVLVANSDRGEICYNLSTGFNSTYSLLSNDTYDGQPINSSNVQIVVIQQHNDANLVNPNIITVHPDGTFDVNPGIPIPESWIDYTTIGLIYKICDINNPANCSNTSDLKINLKNRKRFYTNDDIVKVNNGLFYYDNGYNSNYNVTLNDEIIYNCDGGINLDPALIFYPSHINMNDVTLTQMTFDPHFSILSNGEVVLNSSFPMLPNIVYTNVYRLTDNQYPILWSEATVSVILDTTANKAAVKENTDSVIQIKPNPTKGIFYINFGSQLKQETVINVYNVIGQKVYETKVNGVTESQIDLSDYPSGNYLIKISDGEQITSKTIIKE